MGNKQRFSLRAKVNWIVANGFQKHSGIRKLLSNLGLQRENIPVMCLSGFLVSCCYIDQCWIINDVAYGTSDVTVTKGCNCLLFMQPVSSQSVLQCCGGSLQSGAVGDLLISATLSSDSLLLLHLSVLSPTIWVGYHFPTISLSNLF